MFKGIPFTTRSSPELLKSLDAFDAREDDVLLVSYPKSGKLYLETLIPRSLNCLLHVACLSYLRNVRVQETREDGLDSD